MKMAKLVATILIAASLPAVAGYPCEQTSGIYGVIISSRLDRCRTMQESWMCNGTTVTSYNMTILVAPSCQNY
jgi:hypothetical protein